MSRLTVKEYFTYPETMRPMELVYGIVREPPAPRYGHQSAVTRLGALMYAYVEQHALGKVCVSPIDVVLDEPAALVIQPDIVFVAADRLAIIRDRIWGAPDLVVEVLSPRTARRDRTTKLGWYRQYGVRECWLVDVTQRAIEVIQPAAAGDGCAIFREDESVHSFVLPDWNVPVTTLLD